MGIKVGVSNDLFEGAGEVCSLGVKDGMEDGTLRDNIGNVGALVGVSDEYVEGFDDICVFGTEVGTVDNRAVGVVVSVFDGISEEFIDGRWVFMEDGAEEGIT